MFKRQDILNYCVHPLEDLKAVAQAIECLPGGELMLFEAKEVVPLLHLNLISVEYAVLVHDA